MPHPPFDAHHSWFKQLFDLSPDPTWIIDGNRFVECNAAAISALGYASRAEFLNVHPSKLSPPRQPDGEDSYVKAERMMAFAKDRGLHRFEWTHTRADDINFVAEVTLSAIELRGRQVIYCVWRNIAERKQAEETLLAANQKLALQFEQAPLGFIEWDMAFRVVSWNPAAERILGYSAAEAIGREGHFIIPGSARSSVDPILKDLLEGRGGGRTANENIHKDGKIVYCEWYNASMRDANGRVVGVTSLVDDITSLKRAEDARAASEEQLRESQKMEALGTLAGGVAHDFNNALAAILGNAELARQDVGPDHPALVSLEEIDKASRRAKDLVQQILAFGRRQKMERKPMSLALVVVETARLVRASLPAMLSLNVNCEGDHPVVLADATQVEQILLNLCSNAAHAVQDAGRPGVIEVNLSACERTKTDALGDLVPGRYACLAVRDNGKGMNEATRSRIFEPFFTTKQAGKGTGLGLSVVHGIVQVHQASIEVESRPGEGSTFRVYFPALEAGHEKHTASTLQGTPVQGMGKHVLYLDDEEAIIFLMKRLLERKGYRVSGYTEPRLAIEAVRANPGLFDLAVTDYYMPGMSGLEVGQALKEIRPDLPVVMASGYISEELRAKAPAAGIRELIYKPNTVEDLCEAVARFANAQSVA